MEQEYRYSSTIILLLILRAITCSSKQNTCEPTKLAYHSMVSPRIAPSTLLQ